MVIREYRDEDKRGWVYCRVLSFLNTSYFDDVKREKELCYRLHEVRLYELKLT